jgi:hypothetical protein
MPIKRTGKFLETSDLGFTHSLGIETQLIDDCLREIQRRKLLGVFGCPAFGFKQHDLDFLREIPFIRQVWFWEINLKDVSGLYALKELEYFGLSPKRPALDFAKFPKLKKASWHPVKGDSGLERLDKLEEMDVWRFKPKDQSYAGLPLSKSLRKLDLNWCNPTSLDEMPVLHKLEELQIHYCRNLESIAPLFDVAPNLKRLVITRCANLSDYDVVNEREWERLYINVKGKTVAETPDKTA